MMLGLSAGLVSVGYYASKSCFGSKKRKIHREKLCALIMSKGTGKSRLKNSLNSKAKGLYIVDLGEEVEHHANELQLLINKKEYVDKLSNAFPEARLLILCESMAEAKYIGVTDETIFVCTPSNKLFDTIIGTTTPSTDGAKVELMKKERVSLIRDTDRDSLNIFDSFADLYNVIRTVYRLQSTF